MLIIFVVLAWVLSDILTPYICSLILAYLLAPLVNKLESFGIFRPISGMIVLIFVISILVGLILLVLPLLLEQVEVLITSLPKIYNSFLTLLSDLIPKFSDESGLFHREFSDMSLVFRESGPSIAVDVASYAFQIFDLIILVLLVPVIAFYLLLDWNTIMVKFGNYLPRKSSEEIVKVIIEIDNLLSGFVRGQLVICTILGFFYSVSLSLLGLSYGLLIGVFSGVISFIPFIGAVFGALLAMCVATYQFWDEPSFIAYVGIIFLIGQLFESNFLTPKLIGGAVRLHPIIIMLAVSVGGAAGGMTGILLSVPLAGVVAVLLRRLINQSLANTLFKVKD